ncbi:MAG: hypothetical protein U9Q89_03920 [Thermodesulfobacteriota bacterium]|nr:hypothetical protein [Thermodesulfobacteriota bacterium]
MPGFSLYSNELSIEEKIALAESLWEKYGKDLAADSEIDRLLGLYRKEISKSYELMEKFGVVTECAMCATHVPGGGCCGAGIEDWYDKFVLLLNLLLGREIPSERLGKKDCLFLGPTGCQLFARHHFCINYLCSRITDLLSPAELTALRAQSGKELFLCWQLERILRARIQHSTL